MTERRPFDPSRAHGALLVEHCDVPDGMTLCDYRRQSCAARRASAGRAAEDRGGRGPVLRGLRRALRLA